MGCNCKSETISTEGVINKVKSPVPSISVYIFKILAFLLMIIALPIINLYIIWFIFRTLVLNRDVDIKPLLLAIGSKFKLDYEDDEDDDDYDSLTDDDVELVGVETITNKSK